MSFIFFLDFVGLIASLIALVLCLRIVWRVEKRLDKFFKILSVVIGLVALRQVLRILIHVEILIPASYFSLFDALPIFLTIFGLVVMNRLIKEMDGED